MKRILAALLIIGVLLSAGCEVGGNLFTATIGGRPFRASPGSITVTGNDPPTRQGTLVITGIELPSGIGLSLNISFFIGPATQPLGVNPGSTPGGIGTVTVAPDFWSTPLNGAAGFVTVTERTDTRIAGTFNFTAAAINPGTNPQEIEVENGAFDITVIEGLPPLPTAVGSTAVATIGGTPWNAATIVGIRPGPGVFSIAADNTTYSITILPKVPITAGNTYGIPSEMSMMVISRMGTSESWYGGLGDDVGSVTVTAFETNRLIASFSGTLPPLSGSSSLTVAGGAINSYLE
jgi:hypothetical protein